MSDTAAAGKRVSKDRECSGEYPGSNSTAARAEQVSDDEEPDARTGRNAPKTRTSNIYARFGDTGAGRYLVPTVQSDSHPPPPTNSVDTGMIPDQSGRETNEVHHEGGDADGERLQGDFYGGLKKKGRVTVEGLPDSEDKGGKTIICPDSSSTEGRKAPSTLIKSHSRLSSGHCGENTTIPEIVGTIDDKDKKEHTSISTSTCSAAIYDDEVKVKTPVSASKAKDEAFPETVGAVIQDDINRTSEKHRATKGDKAKMKMPVSASKARAAAFPETVGAAIQDNINRNPKKQRAMKVRQAKRKRKAYPETTDPDFPCEIDEVSMDPSGQKIKTQTGDDTPCTPSPFSRTRTLDPITVPSQLEAQCSAGGDLRLSPPSLVTNPDNTSLDHVEESGLVGVSSGRAWDVPGVYTITAPDNNRNEYITTRTSDQQDTGHEGFSSNPFPAVVVPERHHAQGRSMSVYEGIAIPDRKSNPGGSSKFLSRFKIKVLLGFAVTALLVGVILGVVFSPTTSHDRLEQVRKTLEPFTSGLVLDDPNSPQHRAMIWVSNEDELMVPADDVIKLTQRYALATLFFSTGGEDAWLYKANFLSSKHECSWNEEVPEYRLEGIGWSTDDNFTQRGVFCYKDSLIVGEVSLALNNLTGTLPNEISLLTRLRRIEMWRNNLSGSIPSSLGDLSELNYIQLEFNALNGTIPTSLGNLVKMEEIWLVNNRLSGTIPSIIGSLPELKSLSLIANEMTGTIPNSLGNLSNVAWLDLSVNNFTGTIPSSLNNLHGLEFLFLDTNSLSGTIPFAAESFPRLRLLSLEKNQLDGSIPDSITTYRRLDTLALDENKLTGTLPPEISNLSHLQYLGLDRNHLNGVIPNEIGNLKNLVLIRLSHNNFTGTFPTSLGNLNVLRELYLTSNQLTGTLPDTVGNLLNLEVFSVNRNYFYGSVPQSLASNEALGYLDLAGNNFSGSFDFLCHSSYQMFMADCHPDSQEVECSCCNACCKDDDRSGPVYGCFPK